ncbi:MAG: DUF4115 domain-containing protein, partial [Actinomycetota bacterium]|nr:DUF4115 domain-containing protein [Actinomycetota bacterium]
APARANLLLTAGVGGGGSWIEVHVGSDSGRRLYQGTLEEGQSQRFRAKRLWLNVGRPGSLTWRVNGKATPAPGSEAGLFVVTPRGITPATAPG